MNLDEKSVGDGERWSSASGSRRSRRARTAGGLGSAVIEAEVAQFAGDEQAAFLAISGSPSPRSVGS